MKKTEDRRMKRISMRNRGSLIFDLIYCVCTRFGKKKFSKNALPVQCAEHTAPVAATD